MLVRSKSSVRNGSVYEYLDIVRSYPYEKIIIFGGGGIAGHARFRSYDLKPAAAFFGVSGIPRAHQQGLTVFFLKDGGANLEF